MIDQELHTTGLGGSEVGALFDAHPFLDQFTVKMRKTQPKLAFSGGPNERQRFGKAMEPTTIALYEYLTGRQVNRCDTTRRHEKRLWQIATPDAFCAEEIRGVELKCCFPDQRHIWGDTIEEIPQYALMQCWWYMSVCDIDRWDLVAMVLGEPLPRVYELHRDPEREKVMVDYAEYWWNRYIVGDEVPPVTGSESSREWLKQMFPRNTSAIRKAEPDEVGLLEQYSEIRISESRLTSERALVENEIKLAIREADGLYWPGGKFTWKKTKDSTLTDWQALAEMLMFTMSDEERREKLKLFTQTVPGYRRIHFVADALKEAKAESREQAGVR